mgnify:CR=1 FL=1
MQGTTLFPRMAGIVPPRGKGRLVRLSCDGEAETVTYKQESESYRSSDDINS